MAQTDIATGPFLRIIHKITCLTEYEKYQFPISILQQNTEKKEPSTTLNVKDSLSSLS